MAKRLIRQPKPSWEIYHLRDKPGRLVGIIYNQPDDIAAIQHAQKVQRAATRMHTLVVRRCD
jgi:hypothetical protein